MTPLHSAAVGGKLQVIELLLSKGAEVDCMTNVSACTCIAVKCLNCYYCLIAVYMY